MPERRDPPPTEEGWYALHDFRSIDWDAWQSAPERERQRALGEAVDHLQSALAVEEDAGASALYSVLGHKADLLIVHLRPSTADIGALERRFESTEFARFTDRTTSFVSVTEASGYSERARGYFEGELDEDSGLYRYIQSRLEPTIPDATHVCFYPMDKRREPGQNWYDLPFAERAEHMDAHGEIGQEYGGRVTQMITGAIGIDDWEWGVTLWGDDLADVKDLLYEMRFDPSTSQFAEFGSFYVGRRLPPTDLGALLAGEPVPTDEAGDGNGLPGAGSGTETPDPASGHGGSHGETGGRTGVAGDDDAHSGVSPGSPAEGDHPHTDGTADGSETGTAHGSRADGGGDGAPEETEITGLLETFGLDAGAAYTAGDYGLVVYSDADAEELAEEVEGLRGNFEHYDSHVTTTVRAHGGQAAIISVWTNEGAADTASGFLTDLAGVTETVRGPLGGGPDSGDGEAGGDGATDVDSGAKRGEDDVASIREELDDIGVYAGQPHGEDIYALVLYSRAERDRLLAEVEQLRSSFESYDTHERTSVYADPDDDTLAVVSLWETQRAADTASDFLADLPDVVRWADEGDGFGTMGMFYTVKPDHREDFVERFGAVEELLAETDGHRETSLLVNCDDENDMFIASQWASKEDAMAFFRSEAFTETVDWGRDVLADRPRHVFLA